MKKSPHLTLISENQSRIIEMAWEDRTTFEAIKTQFEIDESTLMKLMRQWLKPSSYRLWRERVKARSAKNLSLRSSKVTRAFAFQQYKLKK